MARCLPLSLHRTLSWSPCHFLVLFLTKRVGLIWSRILSLIYPVVAHVCQCILLVTTVKPMGHFMQWKYFKEELCKNSSSQENIQCQQSLQFTEVIFTKSPSFVFMGYCLFVFSISFLFILCFSIPLLQLERNYKYCSLACILFVL